METPSGDLFSTSSNLENLNILDPENGRYTVTFECDDYFEDVTLFVVGAEQVLEDNFIWVNSSTSGSFSLPQDVIDAGRTIGIRVESIGESDAEPPAFRISHEAEVDIMNYDAQIWSTTKNIGKKVVGDALICNRRLVCTITKWWYGQKEIPLGIG